MASYTPSQLYVALSMEVQSRIPHRGTWAVPVAPYNYGQYPMIESIDAVVADMRRQKPQLCASVRHGFHLRTIFDPVMLEFYDPQFLKYAVTIIAMENAEAQATATASQLARSNALVQSGGLFSAGLHEIVKRQHRELGNYKAELARQKILIEEQSRSIRDRDMQLAAYRAQVRNQKGVIKSRTGDLKYEALDLAPNNLLADELYGQSSILEPLKFDRELDSPQLRQETYGYGHAETGGSAFGKDAMLESGVRIVSAPADIALHLSQMSGLTMEPPDISSAAVYTTSPPGSSIKITLPSPTLLDERFVKEETTKSMAMQTKTSESRAHKQRRAVKNASAKQAKKASKQIGDQSAVADDSSVGLANIGRSPSEAREKDCPSKVQSAKGQDKIMSSMAQASEQFIPESAQTIEESAIEQGEDTKVSKSPLPDPASPPSPPPAITPPSITKTGTSYAAAARGTPDRLRPSSSVPTPAPNPSASADVMVSSGTVVRTNEYVKADGSFLFLPKSLPPILQVHSELDDEQVEWLRWKHRLMAKGQWVSKTVFGHQRKWKNS